DDTSTFTAYNGIAAAETGTTFYVPQAYKGYFAYTSNVIVQNAGTGTATVTVTYKNPDGTSVTGATETQQVPAGASYTFDQAANAGLAANWSGSAVVTADQPVASMFLVSLDSATLGKQLSSGRGAKAGAGRVYMPVVYDLYYTNYTSFLVQNVGSSP